MSLSSIFLTIIISSTIIATLILMPWIFKLFIIIFKKTNYNRLGESSKVRLIHSLNDAVLEMSRTKTGAIITIIKKQSLDHFRTDGLKIDANISTSLILSLFNKKSPLHDGAIIIDNNKILYAGTYYKITSKSIDNKLGARHRAAIGISEQTDALTIVVSEETGSIGFAENGRFVRIKGDSFQEKLTDSLKD